MHAAPGRTSPPSRARAPGRPAGCAVPVGFASSCRFAPTTFSPRSPWIGRGWGALCSVGGRDRSLSLSLSLGHARLDHVARQQRNEAARDHAAGMAVSQMWPTASCLPAGASHECASTQCPEPQDHASRMSHTADPDCWTCFRSCSAGNMMKPQEVTLSSLLLILFLS